MSETMSPSTASTRTRMLDHDLTATSLTTGAPRTGRALPERKSAPMATKPIQYMSVADIAALFDVAPGTVEKWRQRYDNFPVPDAVIGIGHGMPIRGWLPDREAEFREWKKTMPGRGAGGGRPRKTQETSS